MFPCGRICIPTANPEGTELNVIVEAPVRTDAFGTVVVIAPKERLERLFTAAVRLLLKVTVPPAIDEIVVPAGIPAKATDCPPASPKAVTVAGFIVSMFVPEVAVAVTCPKASSGVVVRLAAEPVPILRVPALMVVPPEYELAPFSVSIPVPVFVT